MEGFWVANDVNGQIGGIFLLELDFDVLSYIAKYHVLNGGGAKHAHD